MFKQVIETKSKLLWVDTIIKDVWYGVEALKQKFHKLFSISLQQNSYVKDMGLWDGKMWI